MKTKQPKQVKTPRDHSPKLDLVIEKLEKQVAQTADAPGTCRRFYCL